MYDHPFCTPSDQTNEGGYKIGCLTLDICLASTPIFGTLSWCPPSALGATCGGVLIVRVGLESTIHIYIAA